MKTRTENNLAVGALAVCIGSPGLVFAATDETRNTQVTLDEIVVTAQKREQNLQQVPIAVTAYSAKQLEISGVSTLVELEKSTPNAQFRSSRGTNSTLTAYIRGIGQQDPLWGFEPGIGIYVDDIYIARPQAAVLDVYDVERIEVLRGPQGTLYGKNTVGGAIKYVTKKMTGDASAEVKVAAGAYNQRDVSLAGQLPLIEDKLYAGVTVASFNRDGFGTQYKDYDSATGTFGRTEENYNKEILAGRVSVEYTPNDALFFRLTADAVDDESNNRCGSRFDTNTVAGPNGEFFPALPDPFDSQCGMTEKQNVESQGISLSASYALSDALSLKYIYGYREGETQTFIDFDGTPLDSFEVPAFYEDDQQTHEIQLNYATERFALVSGLYYYEGNAAGAFDALFGQFGTGVLTGSQFTNAVFGDVDTESLSAYFNLNYDLTETVTLTAGVRVTNDDKAANVNRQFRLTANSFPGTTTQGSGITFGDSATDTLLAVRTAFTKDMANDDWTETSPSLKLDWKVAEHIMVYGGWSQGFKSGGFDMRADAAVNPLVVDGYDPETVDTYELGVKSELLDRRLRMNLTLFHSDYKDMQITVQAPAPAPAFFSSTVVNAGEAEIKGFELEAIAQLTANLSSKLVVGYLDGDFIEVQDAVAGDLSDIWEMQNAPEWNGQLALLYDVELANLGALSLSTAVSYRDAVRMFEAVTSPIDQGSYSLWDASAVWTSQDEHWTVGVHLKNLNDEEYRTGGYNFPATAGEDAILGFYGDPRSWTVSLGYEF